MKKPAKSNMYLEAKIQDLAPFDEAIEGDVDASVCVVSYGQLPDEVRAALFAACEGIGMPDPVWLDVSLVMPADVFAAIEGLDPVALIVADEFAAALVGEAYRMKLGLDAFARVLGRSCVAFTSFEADLASVRMKQRNWALIKRLRS